MSQVKPLLSIKNISVSYQVRQKRNLLYSKIANLQAVRDISFDLAAGETLGIVGESGCGKSSLARGLTGLAPLSNGVVIFDGTPLNFRDKQHMRQRRRDIQMIFQDPVASLNPRMTVGDLVKEPLAHFEPLLSKADLAGKVRAMLDRVGILPHQINRYPHEFSGGQCQRIGIARALIGKPKLLICDEPVSALDVSIQAQIINLLKELQQEMGLAMIFVAHDISVVHYIAQRIMVMYLGMMMELSPASDLVHNPRHPYSEVLLSAIPVADPHVTIKPILLDGELPSPLNLPPGCVFSGRCPQATPHCREAIPNLTTNKDQTHTIRCFERALSQPHS